MNTNEMVDLLVKYSNKFDIHYLDLREMYYEITENKIEKKLDKLFPDLHSLIERLAHDQNDMGGQKWNLKKEIK